MKISKPKCEIVTLEQFEQHKLIRTLCKDVTPVKLGVLLCMHTGTRLGELCALRWRDVDLNTGMLRVRYTMQRVKDLSPNAVTKTKVVITGPKSEAAVRDIPIAKELLPMLRKLKASPAAFLLTGLEERFIEPRMMQYHHKALLREAGISDKKFHALRYGFASQSVESGMDAKTLSALLGHSTVTMTLNRYVHPSAKAKRDSVNRLSNWMYKQNTTGIRRQNSGQDNRNAFIEQEKYVMIS